MHTQGRAAAAEAAVWRRAEGRPHTRTAATRQRKPEGENSRQVHGVVQEHHVSAPTHGCKRQQLSSLTATASITAHGG
jgi:hypothetical protein